jgi:hypothetical protein
MSAAVLLVAAVIACAVGMPLLIGCISNAREGLDRWRFGAPQERTKAKQTLVDLLRTRDTRRLAEQTVDSPANEPLPQGSFPQMAKADERAAPEQLRGDLLSGKLPPNIAKKFAMAVFMDPGSSPG